MEKGNGTTFLKVMSILMIISAVGGFISGVTMFGALGALGVLGLGSVILILSVILYFCSAIILLMAGIAGLKLCRGTGAAKPCLIWGGGCVGVQVLVNLINGIWGSGFQLTGLLLGLLIPLLYLAAVRTAVQS